MPPLAFLKAATKAFRELAGRFGFALDPEAWVDSLTVGERQQLEILRLLWLEARVLILDEPTTGISRPQKEKLFATLRILASQGMTPNEIAEAMVLPASLRRSFPNRGYYGTTKHNAKAVYQYYFGWFDGDPAHLDPLPPEEAYPEGAGAPRRRLRRS